MGPHGAPFLGTKRPREEHETADDKSEPPAVGYPSSMVAEVGNTVAEQCNEEEHNSPPRHTPGVTPGATLSTNMMFATPSFFFGTFLPSLSHLNEEDGSQPPHIFT